MFKRAFIILPVWLLSVFCLLPSFAIAQDDIGKEILYYTNKFRRSKGKPPLELENTISKEAGKHSRDMAAGRRPFGHGGFEQRTRNIKAKLGFIAAAAENVAYGHLNAREVVDLWIESPGHRKNMLGDYNLMGVGTARSKNGIIYFTQTFVRKE